MCVAQTDMKKKSVYSPIAIKQEVISDSNYVYTQVEKMSTLKDYGVDWKKYVSENLKVPEKAKTDGIKGKIVLTFVVEKNGSTSDIKILRGVREDCDQEVARIAKASKWIPAFNNGKPVRSLYSAVVTF
jgi:TonB family protein